MRNGKIGIDHGWTLFAKVSGGKQKMRSRIGVWDDKKEEMTSLVEILGRNISQEVGNEVV
jgi:hypothetical protein